MPGSGTTFHLAEPSSLVSNQDCLAQIAIVGELIEDKSGHFSAWNAAQGDALDIGFGAKWSARRSIVERCRTYDDPIEFALLSKGNRNQAAIRDGI